MISTKYSPSKNDLERIKNGMKEAFAWYWKWMKKLPKTNDDWDLVVKESRDMWNKYDGLIVIQNVIIELMTDLERW